VLTGYIVSRDCSISVTISCENTKNFTVKREEKNTVYRLRTLFSRFKDLQLKYQNVYRLLIFRPPPHLDPLISVQVWGVGVTQ
jgi:hypothetical protein